MSGLELITVGSVVNIDYCRMIIVQSKGILTTPPSTLDVLAYANPLSPIAYNAQNAYVVVLDKLFTYVPGGDTQVQKYTRTFAPPIKEARFIPSTNNVYNGQLYYLTICSVASNTTVNGYLRLWFEDGN